MSSAHQQCTHCGSLGPHSFLEKGATPVEPAEEHRTSRHKESYIPEYVESPEKQASSPVDDAPAIHRHNSGRIHVEDDSSFPAGMRSHSPILDHIRRLDGEEQEEAEKPRSYRERTDYFSDSRVNDEDESQPEEPQASESNNMVAIIVGVVLVLALLITAVYVINNFEEITTWLASPTVPEFYKPSAE